MRDPVLGAVQNPLVAIFLSDTSHAHGVASRVRFGQAPRANPLTRRQFGQPALLLLLAAKLQNMPGAKAVVRSHGQANGATHLGQFFNGHLVLIVPQAGTSVLLRNQHPHQSQLPHPLKQVPGKMLAFVPLHSVWQNFLKGKITDTVANQALV